jgi:hypothetical protein
LRCTLFHGFDTLGSPLEGRRSLDYDDGFVLLQIHMNFDTIIYRQHTAGTKIKLMSSYCSAHLTS